MLRFKGISSSMLHFSSIIFFIRSVFFLFQSSQKTQIKPFSLQKYVLHVQKSLNLRIYFGNQRLICRKFGNVKGIKELTFIMILPLQMFDITQYLTKIKCHQFIYLFIQIQILIGFQTNRFVTKYSKQKFMEQIKSMLFVFRFLFILQPLTYVNLDCYRFLFAILKKIIFIYSGIT